MMYAKVWKRVLDFSLSLLALIILLPLLLVLTIAGAVAMKGNPFFVQKRPGRIDPKTGKERIISLLKFRTMTNEKDENGVLLPDEKRLVPYGLLLRKTSLDELPSLLNILIGDLAVIGPRPLLVKYLPYYTEHERKRHTVRPGLTGWAQVHGRNTVSWEERFELDVWYTENITVKTDLIVLVDTVRTVFSHSGVVLNALEDFDDYRKHAAPEKVGNAK